MKSLNLAGLLILPWLAVHCKPSQSSRALEDEGFHAPQTGWKGKMGLLLEDRPGVSGAFVVHVNPSSYADAISFQAGDIIESVNGLKISSVSEFNSITANAHLLAPKKWEFGVVRNDTAINVTNSPKYKCDPSVLIRCGPRPNLSRSILTGSSN